MTICDGDYTCIDGVSQRRCMDMCGNESFITGGTACKNSAQTHDAYTKTSCGTADQCPDRPFSSAGAYTPCNKAAGTFSASTTSQANTNAKNAANTCIQDFVNSKDCKCVIWQYKSNCASCGSGCTHNPDVPVKGEGPTANAAYLDAKAKADALSCEYACKCPSTTGTIVFTLASSECSSADGKLSISKGTSRQDVSIQLQVGQSKTVSGLELGTWSIGTSGYFIGVCGGPSSSGQITMRLDKSSVSLTSGSPTARVTLTAYRYG